MDFWDQARLWSGWVEQYAHFRASHAYECNEQVDTWGKGQLGHQSGMRGWESQKALL